LFISDEVQTGFGRTGDKWWGIEQWGVKPDMITMAKGMGNGIPLGGVTCTTEVAESMREKVHFNTYGGNPVSMMAGLAVLETIERNKYMHNCKVMGDRLHEGFDKLVRNHKIVGEHRGKGLMRGLEIVKDKQSKEVAPQHVQRAMELCKDRGLLIGRGGMAANTIRIKPPFCVTKDDTDFIVKTLDEVFTIIEKG
jgi:alanine-glyoxylate transaminase/(R)-3-amino-2-methylpropionate-pyruvate transaminase